MSRPQVHGVVEVEPYPHLREACTEFPFDRTSPAACRRFCNRCRCFICDKPPSKCLDWESHALSASTSVQSQQRRKIFERRRKMRGEEPFDEPLTARAFYLDGGSSRGSTINGKRARRAASLRSRPSREGRQQPAKAMLASVAATHVISARRPRRRRDPSPRNIHTAAAPPPRPIPHGISTRRSVHRGERGRRRYARGRVPLRLGDAIKVGHTEVLFAVQPPGWAAPLRAEMCSSSDSSDDGEPKPRTRGLLKDVMKGTLAGIVSKKEFGVDSDEQDEKVEAKKKDTTALQGVTSKEERMKRLASMRSHSESPEERRKRMAGSADIGGQSSSPDVKMLASQKEKTAMDELRSGRHATQGDDMEFGKQDAAASGLGFLSKSPSKKQTSFKWGSK